MAPRGCAALCSSPHAHTDPAGRSACAGSTAWLWHLPAVPLPGPGTSLASSPVSWSSGTGGCVAGLGGPGHPALSPFSGPGWPTSSVLGTVQGSAERGSPCVQRGPSPEALMASVLLVWCQSPSPALPSGHGLPVPWSRLQNSVSPLAPGPGHQHLCPPAWLPSILVHPVQVTLLT